MYKLAFSFLLLLLPSFTFASQGILYDHYFSPYSGSANLIFAQELLIAGEDFFFDGSGRDTTTKVWGRTAEQFLFWYPLSILSSTTQHEIFGHGYRLRELGFSPTGYSISLWGGATYFEVDSSLLMGELLAIDVAGLEAEAILARDLKMQWISQGKIEGRLGYLYTETMQSLFWYTVITQLGRLKNEEASAGNDIEAYILHHNASYLDGELTVGALTRLSIFNWLDPMTFYAYYAFFYYIAEGKSWNFPMIPLGKEVRYLPNIRIGYAPYSPEIYLENFFSIREEPLYVYCKGGEKSFGFGVKYNRMISKKKIALGCSFDVWNQRAFLSTATIGDFIDGESVFRPVLNQRSWGTAFSVKMTLKLFSRLGIYSEVGAKTAGYLPGYSLREDLFTRIGLIIKPSS